MKFACVFPGQGSQSVGMLADLASGSGIVAATFAEGSDVLGYDLWQTVSDGPQQALDDTRRTQPAMLCAGVATWRVWRELGGPLPVALAGHSLGEYTALVCADALDFAAAVALVERRAQLMQDAVPPGTGAMAAVLGLDDADVAAACTDAAQGQVLEPVNFNAPGQVVVAGDADAVARLRDTATARGARRVLDLPVSVPSHCALMRPAAAAFAAHLEQTELRRATIPILHNAGPVDRDDASSVRAALARQLYSPVPWRATVEQLIAQGVETFIECGPGRVLTGLIKRTSKAVTVRSLHDTAALRAALDEATQS